MTAVDGLQDPYLSIINIPVSKNLNLYNKEIFGLTEINRYDLNRYKLTEFYQEFEDAVSTFGFKSAVLIVIDIDTINSPTEVKNIILSYPSITQIMVESHCEILWADNSGENLGRQPTANYVAAIYDAEKQVIIAHKDLRYNMLCLCIKNSLTTDTKCK